MTARDDCVSTKRQQCPTRSARTFPFLFPLTSFLYGSTHLTHLTTDDQRPTDRPTAQLELPPQVPFANSLDATHAPTATRATTPQMGTATRSTDVSSDGSTPQLSDLSTLHVTVGERRLSSDGTWLYSLQVTCSRSHWQVAKRYSEIRELWRELCRALGAAATGDAQRLCSEHTHFLAGLEQDAFPKKHLLLTQHKLETRARDLNQFFRKLAMRLTLCQPRELQQCRLRGCALLELIVGFFAAAPEQMKRCGAPTGASRSFSMQCEAVRHRHHNRCCTLKRRGSSGGGRGAGVDLIRRLSLGVRGPRGVVAALAQRELQT